MKVKKMVPRRSDRELVEHMLNYMTNIKSIATEGELATALNINSETANKWLELFLLIKQNCPDFQYKKLGRYRIIDMVGIGGLAQEMSQVKLTPIVGSRYRVTRSEALNAIHSDIRRIAKMLIWQLRQNDLDIWYVFIEDSRAAFAEVIDVNLNQLTGSDKQKKDFQAFKSSLQANIDLLYDSIETIQTDEAPKKKLKLITLERNFIKKLVYITTEFEESVLKTGKKPDYLTTEEPMISSRSNMLAEMKVTLDNLPKTLQKPDMKDVERIRKRSKVIPYLKCFSCNIEQQFPIHCTQSMDYEDGNLICEICKEKAPIPTCSKCNRQFGIGVKKMTKG
ncbi:MAG: hypothetical protein FK733_06105 [Asgard group archaeon]|nr:hypothetical protein [Asgard group archaeon]